MATVNPSPSLQPLVSQRRFLGWSLFWGSVVLTIMAHWLRTKYAQVPLGVLAALLLLSGGAAILSWLLLIRVPASAEALRADRTSLGPALLPTALVLLPGGIWLISRTGLETLEPAWGLALFCLAGVGLWLAVFFPIPTTVERDERDKRQSGVALVVAGLALIPAGLWLLFGFGSQALGEGLGLIT